MSTPEPVSVSVSLDAVAPKIPPFYAADIRLWLSRVEANFRKGKINAEQTKFDHVVGVLDERVAARVRQVIETPDSNTPWTVLRDKLLEVFEKSPFDRADALIDHAGLGDRVPSDVWGEFLALNGNQEGPLLRRLFLRHLPIDVQNAMAAEAVTCSATEFGRQADAFYRNRRQVVGPAVHLLADAAAVDAFRPSGRKDFGSKPYRRSANRKNAAGHCFYHDRFGPKAHRCEQPCSWVDDGTQPKNELGGRQ